ncbi:MAG: TAXI family TRAP transporter solute-binding subunit [Planctomycetales bacterium]|nr:TAXI family TRAP transporter solute-binding subunit [Planctomycetales bacterium]
MKKLRLLLVAVLILLPFGVHYCYHWLTDLPREVAIATGPEHGRYHGLAESLARELENRHNIDVRLVPTSGTFANLRLLRTRQVDLALYQSGSPYDDQPDENAPRIQAVAALYPEVVHLLVARDFELTAPGDLAGKRVAIGPPDSGDRATSDRLLRHFGLGLKDVDGAPLNYAEIEQAFRDGELDAAFLTLGVNAPILPRITASDACRLAAIPFAAALVRRTPSMSSYTLPAGMYQANGRFAPPQQVETVALRAQLITRDDTHAGLIAAATRILLSEDFQKANQLVDLFENGKQFATSRPDFPLHAGAIRVYDPELHPIVNSDFVEATEGTRSFVVSLLIAGYLAFRWFRQRQERKQEHRLDRYMTALLDIERRQMELDQQAGANDIERLQTLLDEITTLRQQALGEFTAHDMNEDRSVECFVHMCHSLSDKVNAKMTRQRFERQIERLLKKADTSG